MAEVRDRVRKQITEILCPSRNLFADCGACGYFNSVSEFACNNPKISQILAIKELAQGLEAVEKGWNAKVNRDAELPKCPYINRAMIRGWDLAQQDMADWVQEEKWKQ